MPFRRSSRFRKKALYSFVLVVALVGLGSGLRWLQRRMTPAALREIQLTHNSTDDGVTDGSLSPDGRYLAFTDLKGMHLIERRDLLFAEGGTNCD